MSSEDEVAALDRIKTRIALTKVEELEALIGKLLCALIKKLATPDEAVRSKTLELLQLVNTRISPEPGIQLPAVQLLETYRGAPDAGALVRSVAINYVAQALHRMPLQARPDLVGPLLQNIAAQPPTHRARLLQLACEALAPWAGGVPVSLEESRDALEQKCPFLASEADRACFLEHALKLLLLLPSYKLSARVEATDASESRAGRMAAAVAESAAHVARLQGHVAQAAAPPAPPGEATNTTHPGLSTSDVAAVAPAGVPASLDKQKAALLWLISAAEAVPPQDAVLHALAASCDPSDEVLGVAEQLLRRKCTLDGARPAVNLEDRALMSRLFRMVLGCTELMQSAAAQAAAPVAAAAGWAHPASHALQIRLLRVACKSAVAANMNPLTLQVIVAGLRAGSAARVKQATMEFAVWAFQHASDAQMAAMAPLAFRGITRMLERGAAADGAPGQQLRAFLYQAAGQLAERAPGVYKGDLGIAERFFGALATEPDGVRATVQEALNRLSAAYKDLPPGRVGELREMLAAQARSAADGVRMCAVAWACAVLPFGDPVARHLCLMAAADAKQEVRAAALRGLRLPADPSSSAAAPRGVGAGGTDDSAGAPTFAAVMATVREQHPGLSKPPRGPALVVPAATLLALLRFLDTLPTHAADGSAAMDVDGAGASGGACDGTMSDGYLLLLEHALVRDAPSDVQAAALTSLLSLAAEHRGAIAQRFVTRLPFLRAFLAHTSPTVRALAARLLGIVATALPAAAAAALIDDLRSRVPPPKADAASGNSGGGALKFEEQHGSVTACGFVCAGALEFSGEDAGVRRAVEACVGALVATLGAGDAQLAAAAAAALGHVQLAAPLPLPAGEGFEVPEKTVPHSAAGPVDATMAAVCRKIYELCTDPRLNSHPLRRLQAITAAGHLAAGSANEATKATLVHILLAQTPAGDVEDVHFTVGEALCLAFGATAATPAAILREPFTTLADHRRAHPDAPADAAPPRAPAPRPAILAATLRNAASSNADVRCAAAVWLLCLLTFCAAAPEVAACLGAAQDALLALLGDQSELTQEVASRGLAVAHDAGDAATRERLVTALVATLSGQGRPTKAVKVDGDTQVFEPGTVGGGGGGGGITTYKELCAMATDLGQPDLVYKFMDVAHHAAAMKSKRGAAFGVASIAAQSLERLAPHVATLLPKLYRYSYDPNARVQEAMAGILAAVVPERQKALTEHFDAVMRDLLAELGSRLWRHRQAACLAAADLLQGRRWPALAAHFAALWEMALRVADDVKDSVRANGERLLRAVAGLTCRLASAEHTAPEDAAAALAVALPVLVGKGLQSRVAAVKARTLNTLSAIVDVAAPPQIAPQLPALVAALLEALSTLEASAFGQLEMHAERLGVDAGALEAKRVALSSQTPMHSALDRCARLVSADSVDAVVAVLTSLIRRGVGLNTRAGTARFIVSLQDRLPAAVMQKPAGELLKALVAALRAERSGATRKAFAGACGALCKAASAKRVTWLVQEALSMHATGGTDGRVATGMLLAQCARHAASKLDAEAAAVLPVAFRARFDPARDAAAVWQDVWSELAASEASALTLHGAAIVDALLADLQADEWERRVAAAAVVEAVAATSGAALQPFAPALAQQLLAQLQGRIWAGKPALPRAVGALAAHCAPAYEPAGAAPDSAAVIAALVAACGRKHKEYAAAAADALQAALRAFKSRSHARAVVPLVEAAHAHLSADVEMATDDDAGDDNDGAAPRLPLLATVAVARAALEAPLATATTGAAADDGAAAALTPALQPVAEHCLAAGQPWALRLEAILCTKALLDAAALQGGRGGAEAASKLVKLVAQSSDDKLSQVRAACLTCFEAAVAAPAAPEDVRAAVRATASRMAAADKDPALRARAKALAAAVAAGEGGDAMEA